MIMAAGFHRILTICRPLAKALHFILSLGSEKQPIWYRHSLSFPTFYCWAHPLSCHLHTVGMQLDVLESSIWHWGCVLTHRHSWDSLNQRRLSVQPWKELSVPDVSRSGTGDRIRPSLGCLLHTSSLLQVNSPAQSLYLPPAQMLWALELAHLSAVPGMGKIPWKEPGLA